MDAEREAIADVTYALFALGQPLSFDELAEASRTLSFPLAATQTPQWFAAAADDDYDLLEAAPELLVLPSDLESADDVDTSNMDLIYMYAPELLAARALEDDRSTAPAQRESIVTPEVPRTATQIGLLSELSDLDD